MTGSIIKAAWYQPSLRRLDLLFDGGRLYRYASVPAEVAGNLARTPFKGRFYNRHIRNLYPCEEIGADLCEVA